MSLVAGVDEVGWGACAGPLAVGVVVLRPETGFSTSIRDSKKFSGRSAHTDRGCAGTYIKSVCAGLEIFPVPAHVVDSGPARAKAFAFMQACAWVRARFGGIDIVCDGSFEPNMPSGTGIKYLPKADATVAAVAAASVVAKYWHDSYMIWCCTDPALAVYEFDSNKGYITKKHIAAISRFGPSYEHRPRWLRNTNGHSQNG